jgi:hypothetical protein
MRIDPARCPPDREGETIEAAVLELLLALHPTQLTLDELSREIGTAGGRLGAAEITEPAVRHLVGAGLLHHHGPFLVPTRAALRCDQLLGG